MRRRTSLRIAAAALAVVVVAVAVAVVVVAVTSGGHPNARSTQSAVGTGTVERGPLAEMVAVDGTLTYRARADGSPYAAINQARGTYTALPQTGDTIRCGGALYRVDDHPVLLVCGTTPAYRSLAVGSRGPDVAELNANLVRFGYATAEQLDPDSRTFGAETAAALKKLQAARGADSTGALALGKAIVLPEAIRVADVAAELGGPAQPGTKALDATSTTLGVQLALDPSQLGQVKPGDRVDITLPDNSTAGGHVDRLGRIAQAPAGKSDGPSAGPTIPAFIRLDAPATAHGLDHAPVHVAITVTGIANALSVPATSIVGKAGGGFAVEVVRADGRRELVPVQLGLFDTSGGRVQVNGDVHPGDRVVVPSS